MIGLGYNCQYCRCTYRWRNRFIFKERYKKIATRFLATSHGIAVLFIGIGGTLSQMLVFKDGHLETTGTMLMIFSLLIGTLIGEIINTEAKLERLGEFARKIFHADEQSKFVDAFVTVTHVICIGAMAIIGALQDGLSGDYSLLLTKAVLRRCNLHGFCLYYGYWCFTSSLATIYLSRFNYLMC